MPVKVAPSAAASKKAKLSGIPACELPCLFSAWLGLPAGSPSGLYSSVRTFWLFLYQVLSADGSCQEAVDQALAWIGSRRKRPLSDSTSAYCQARQRLDLNWLVGLAHRLVTHIEDAAATVLWHGHRVVVVDGSSASMPDTKVNQEQWPQPSRQKPGCGFPVVRFVALFSLATGALLESAIGPLTTSERELFRRLWRYLKRGDVVLGDRGFGSWGEFYFLAFRGVDFVSRLNPRRSTGVRHHKQLGKGDRLVEWVRSGVAPDWITKEVWKSLPDTILVREITYTVQKCGFRTKAVTVVTTLLDAQTYPPESFADLYMKRWKAELWLRDLKTTMGMDVLATKSPDMIRKELVVHWIAYNLVRALIAESRRTHDFDRERVSFKGCVNLVRT